MTREYKSFGGSYELKMTDEELGIVEHYISIFGVVDRVGDVVHPGAFTKTLAERGGKVLVLDNHRTTGAGAILGKPLSMREVGREELPMEILRDWPEATGGLKAETQFAMETQAGREAFALIKMGALSDWSFAYDIVRKDYSASKSGARSRTRNLKEVKLFEYSPVLIAANAAVGTVSVKSDGEDSIAGLREAVDRMGEALAALRQEWLEAKGLELTGDADPDVEPNSDDAEPGDTEHVDPLTSGEKSLAADIRKRQVRLVEAEMAENELLMNKQEMV